MIIIIYDINIFDNSTLGTPTTPEITTKLSTLGTPTTPEKTTKLISISSTQGTGGTYHIMTYITIFTYS